MHFEACTTFGVVVRPLLLGAGAHRWVSSVTCWSTQFVVEDEEATGRSSTSVG